MTKTIKTPSPKEVGKKVNSYFKQDNKKVTITGLMLYLGFKTKQYFYNYAKKGDEHREVIDNARLRVEHYYEELLMGNKVTGAIFALKNMGWSDRNDINISERRDVKFEVVHFDGLQTKKIDSIDAFNVLDIPKINTIMLNNNNSKVEVDNG